MKTSSGKPGKILFGALVASVLIWGVSSTIASGGDGKFSAQDLSKEVSPQPQGVISPTPTPTPTPSGTPPPQIDGSGTIAAPNGGRPAQFFIFDVENEQVTPQFLEGIFGYLDKRSHINFITGKIQTVTINGNQGAFTGTARIGGPRNKQIVQFTVTVTANQSPTPDTFSIVLSNGYSASGNLTSGRILIHTLDPD